ncbi:MAG: hypothetical protein KJZ86_16470 [Caldilineaceae bacterium]|nr:hypothetical protein [Caldilineaceae bacterium]HRJ41730.1 hypothetical protein [Caldilineaceae bacterium]
MNVVKPSLGTGEHQLSLARLLWLDLPVVVSGALLAGVWLVAIFAGGLGYFPVGWGRIVFSAPEVWAILTVALILTLLGGPVLIWRIVHFRSILRHGVVLHGQVIRRWFTFAEYRVDYIFHYQYQPFQQRNAVRRQRHIEARRALEPGSVVVVLVHPYLPERSLLVDLYRV